MNVWWDVEVAKNRLLDEGGRQVKRSGEEKSVEFMKRVIKAWCPSNGFIYDPCAGTMTTALAAADIGGHYVFSVEPDTYCFEAAVSRLRSHFFASRISDTSFVSQRQGKEQSQNCSKSASQAVEDERASSSKALRHTEPDALNDDSRPPTDLFGDSPSSQKPPSCSLFPWDKESNVHCLYNGKPVPVATLVAEDKTTTDVVFHCRALPKGYRRVRVSSVLSGNVPTPYLDMYPNADDDDIVGKTLASFPGTIKMMVWHVDSLLAI